jgi:CRP-like cAMP-binding protein
MKNRLRESILEKSKRLNYALTEDSINEIIDLYELNYKTFDENDVIAQIEKFVVFEKINKKTDSKMERSRSATIWALSIDPDHLEVAKYVKSPETFDFLISRLGTDIPFCFLNLDQKKFLIESMYPLILEKDHTLIAEGGYGTEMYIVEEGEFDVLIKDKPTNKLYRGSVFGELALLYGTPRTATVKSVIRSKVWAAEQTSLSCIRLRDRLYREKVIKEAIQADEELMKIIGNLENLDQLVQVRKDKFISSGKTIDLEDGEIAVVLKNAKIIDFAERSVAPKDLIKTSFYTDSELECMIIDMNLLKK